MSRPIKYAVFALLDDEDWTWRFQGWAADPGQLNSMKEIIETKHGPESCRSFAFMDGNPNPRPASLPTPHDPEPTEAPTLTVLGDSSLVLTKPGPVKPSIPLHRSENDPI